MSGTLDDDAISKKLARLERELNNYLALGKGIAPRTRRNYEKAWAQWETFCRQRRLAPIPAPIEAYQAFLGAAANGTWTDNGLALKYSTVASILSAIKHYHVSAGYTPACDKHEHHRAFTDALKGYRRSVSKPVDKAKELDVPTVKTLLAADEPLSRVEKAYQAIFLLSLDHHMTLRDILDIKHGQIHRQPDQSIFVSAHDGIDVPCQCTDLEANQLCLACLLADLEDDMHPSGRPLTPQETKQPLCQTLGSATTLMRNQGEAWKGIAWQGDRLAFATDDDEMRDQVRYVLTHYASRTGAINRARTKMAIALAFYAGLRAGNDLDNIRRSGIKKTPGGYRITVRKSKTDQAGQGWDFGIAHTQDPDLDPVVHLENWLAIRDLAEGTAPDGPLAFPVAAGGRRLNLKSPTTMHRIIYGGFDELQAFAGVSGYSLHSLRRGYATEAYKQGRDLEGIQRTMRHVSADSTAAYIGAPSSHSVLEQLGERL